MTDPESVVLRQLMDRELVKELRAQYCRFLDLQQWDELRGIFTEDAEFDLAGGTHLVGVQSYVELMIEHFSGAGQVIHHCVMPELKFVSEDRCLGIWALFSYVDRGCGSSRRVSRNYSYYMEEYVRRNGSWKIASLKLLRVRADPVGDAASAETSSELLHMMGNDLSGFLR